MRLFLLALGLLVLGCQSNRTTPPHLWQEPTPTVIETPRASNFVTAIGFADVGGVLAIGMVDDSVQLHRTSDFKLLAKRPGRAVNGVDQPGVHALAMNPRGDRIVVQHTDTGIWMYDGHLRPIIQLAGPYKPRCVGFLWLADGSGVIGFAENAGGAIVLRWDAAGRETYRFVAADWKTGSDTVAHLIERPNGHVLIAAGWEARELTALDLKPIRSFKAPDTETWNPIEGIAAGPGDWFHMVGLREFWTISPDHWSKNPVPMVTVPFDYGAVAFAPNRRDYAILGAFEPDLRPIRLDIDPFEFSTVLDTSEPANASRRLLAFRWEGPTTLAIYTHLCFNNKPGRLQRHRVHLDYASVPIPRPADRREPEPAKAVDSIFPDSTAPTTQPGGGLFGNENE